MHQNIYSTQKRNKKLVNNAEKNNCHISFLMITVKKKGSKVIQFVQSGLKVNTLPNNMQLLQ